VTTHRVAWIGGMASVHGVREQLPPGCELLAACEVRQDKLDQWRAEDPGLTVTEDYRQIAAMDGVDSVISFTPNETHRDIAVACLEGGKNVFIEKPMGVTLEQGRDILEAEQQSGRCVGVDLEFRYSRIGQDVKRIIDSGEIGELLQVDCDHHRGGWLNDSPQGRYRTKRGTSGLFKMEGIHMLDLLRFWAGEVETCWLFNAANALPQYEFADNATVMMRFAGGVQGRMTLSHTRAAYSLGADPARAVKHGHTHKLSAVGSKGALLIDFWAAHIDVLRLSAKPNGTDSLKPEFERRIDYSGLTNPLKAGHDMGGCRMEFLRRMGAGQPPYQPARDAFRSETIAYALDEGVAAEGGVIDCTALAP